MRGYQAKYAAAFAMVQRKASDRSRMFVAKHRVLRCLIRVDGSDPSHLNPPGQFCAEPPLASTAAKDRVPPKLHGRSVPREFTSQFQVHGGHTAQATASFSLRILHREVGSFSYERSSRPESARLRKGRGFQGRAHLLTKLKTPAPSVPLRASDHGNHQWIVGRNAIVSARSIMRLTVRRLGTRVFTVAAAKLSSIAPITASGSCRLSACRRANFRMSSRERFESVSGGHLLRSGSGRLSELLAVSTHPTHDMSNWIL